METEEKTSLITDELPDYLCQKGQYIFSSSSKSQDASERKNKPEEEEDGSAVADSIYVVIVIHVWLDGIDETWVKLLSFIKDEQSLRAAQHHVPDRFSQLALDTKRRTKLQRQKSLHIKPK